MSTSEHTKELVRQKYSEIALQDKDTGKLPQKQYGLFVDKKFINLNCKV